MLALDGLLCVSVGDCSREPCGGGVGCCCIRGRCEESTLRLALLSRVVLSSSCAVDVCVSSGGHVARSCSAGETTSSGVGIVRSRGSQGHSKNLLITHESKGVCESRTGDIRIMAGFVED
jgi:hypothetical protein